MAKKGLIAKTVILLLLGILIRSNSALFAATNPVYNPATDPDIYVAYVSPSGFEMDAYSSLFPYNIGSTTGGASKTQNFKIYNNAAAGHDPINISSATIINDSSSGWFSFSTAPAVSIPAGTSTNFGLLFSPPAGASAGTYSCTIDILSNDPDESEYCIPITAQVTSTAAPAIILRQGSTFIQSCGALPSDIDSALLLGSFDFGEHVTTAIVKQFTIENAGNAKCNNLNVSIGGTTINTYNISAVLSATSIDVGQVATFSVRYSGSTPVADDKAYITISFTGGTDYIISIHATTTSSSSAEINLMQGVHSIPYDTQHAASNLDFGNVKVLDPIEGYTGFLRSIIDVRNLGTSALTISGPNDSSDTSGAFVITPVPTSISAPGSGFFVLTFEPPSYGPYSTTITLRNTSDPSEGTYSLTAAGTGIAPGISVKDESDATLGNGSKSDFSDITKGSNSSWKTIKIKNTGNADLNMSSISAGGDTSDFEITNLPSSYVLSSVLSIVPYPQIRFKPSSDGPKKLTITIADNDPIVSNKSYVIYFIGNVPSACVEVRQVSSTGTESVVDATHDADLGWQAIGVASTSTFRVYDTGTEDWKNGALSKSGTTAGDFVPSVAAFTTISSGGVDYREFKVVFTPSAINDRSATITVTGDDNGESTPGAHPRSLQFMVKGKGFNKPTAQIDPPAGLLKKLDATPLVYYGPAPFTATVHATTTYATQVEWDLGTGSYGSPETAMTKTVSLDVGLHDVRVIPLDADGNQGDPATISIGAYPNDIASIPPVTGVPFDNEPPFIDGILAYSDGNLDHAQWWDPSSPLVDYGENGWTGCLSLPFADGSTPNARIDCIRAGNFLYFAFHVESDNTPAADDQIVVGIGKDKDARITDKDKIGIFTISTAAASGTASTNGVTVSSYTTDPAHTNPTDPGIWSAAGAPPAGTTFAVRQDALSTNSWSAELKVPISGTGLAWLDSLAGNFLLFVRIDKIEPNPTSPPPTTDAAFVWPRGIPAAVASQELHSEWWGLACHDGSIASNGLSIASFDDIGVRTDPLNITAPLVNTFSYRNPSTSNDIVNYVVARVTNDARLDRVDPATGNPVTTPLEAQNVTVRFKLADWGIPSADPTYWHDIVQPTDVGNPSTSNPPTVDTVPAPTLAGTVLTPATKDFIMQWQLSASQINDVSSGLTAVNGEPVWHQCMLAQIETGGTGTGTHPVSIVTRSVCRNMDFTEQNEGPGFSSEATVSAKGLGSFVAGIKANARAQGDNRVILLRLYTRDWQESPKSLAAADSEKARRIESARRLSSAELPGPVKPTPLPGAQHYLDELRSYIEEARKTVYFTEYIVKAYVYTGRTVQHGSKASNEVTPLGSYGYVVRHVGFTEGWSFHIDGAEKIDYRTYLIRVKSDQTWKITDHIKAVLPPRWSFGLMGGVGWGVPSAGNFTSAGGGATGICMLNSDADEKGQIASLQLGLGYDSFPAGGSTDAWKTGSLSLAARFSLPLLVDWFRWYCTMGGGLFQNDSSALKIGWVVGTGLDLGVSYPIHIQLGADALINKAAGGLLHLNAGLIYRLTR